MANSEKVPQTSGTSGYDTLGQEIPFGGKVSVESIPEDLKGIPENIAKICIKEREVMDSPNLKDKCAFNLFANDGVYQDPKTFNKKSPSFKKTIDSPGFWQPERATLQDYGIQRQFEDAVALSESMRTEEREAGIPPTIYMLSGISAAGKTTACKNANYPGMLYKTKADGGRGDPIGPLATDNSKTYLWMAGGSCGQIHAESSMMMRKIDGIWKNYVREKGGDCSEVRDKTFSEIGDVRQILTDAEETGRRVCDLDIDVPFIVSAVGVMMRPAGSHEPHPGFDYLKDNYALMKVTRLKKLGNLYPNSEVNVDYFLRCYDYSSNPKQRQKEVARYEKDADGKKKLVIIDQALFNQSIARKQDAQTCRDEADSVGNLPVTQEFIDDYCQKFINSDDQEYIDSVKKSLGVYVDEEHPKTVRDIINDNEKYS